MNWDWKLDAEGQKLVAENMNLVRNVIKKRYGRCFSVEREDLIQIGNLGLIGAAHHFVKRKKTGEILDCNFSTFAWPRIAIYINRELNTQRYKERLALAIKNLIGQFYLARGKRLSLREVAIIFETDEQKIKDALIEDAGFENLDDRLNDSGCELFVDDRLSALDLLILKEEHLMKEAKGLKDKIAVLKRGLNWLSTKGEPAVWESEEIEASSPEEW